MAEHLKMPDDADAIFARDFDLGYHKALTFPSPSNVLVFDESYRRAHLPLIAPDHPLVIAEDDERGYAMGVHRMFYSAVVPVPPDLLESAPQFMAMDGALRAAPFAAKLAWDLLPKRRAALHATICGTLAVGKPPTLPEKMYQNFRNIGPFSVELRGLFSGNLNIGRLYLPLYPQQRDGRNLIHALQEAFGKPSTDMYLVGLYNFMAELTIEESAALRNILLAWQDKPLLRWVCDEIWILGARDDLVLDREIAEKISLK